MFQGVGALAEKGNEMTPTWIIMPVLADPLMTMTAISDCLAQSVPTRILVVNQGVEDDFRHRLEQVAEEYPDRVFCWHHQPPLLSLAATWNRALDFVWTCGGEEALVVNNDVRLHRETVRALSLILSTESVLFVSALGVREEQFEECLVRFTRPNWTIRDASEQRGGPDFSCFLIAKACHDRFRFDEAFSPAFCEDLDYHRRLMLAGEGSRIFSVNLPYLHYASNTLKTLGPDQAARIRHQIETVSRAHYRTKWGGAVNEETFWYPYGDPSRKVLILGAEEQKVDPAMQAWCGQPTTPKLQAYVQQHAIAPTLTEFQAMDKLLGEDAAGSSVPPTPNPLYGLLAADPAADITGVEDWRQPRECGQLVPSGTGSTVCRRALGHEGPCSSKSTVLCDPETETGGWTAEDRQRALEQPEDLDE